jgi:hypothetical protein
MFKFVVFLAFATLPSISNAATILFEDLTDQVSVVSAATTRIADLSCGTNATNEFCIFNLLAPPGATLLSDPQNIAVAEGPGPSFVSDDIIAGVPIGRTFAALNFDSDVDASQSLFPCNTPPPTAVCTIVEDGTVQTAFQLFWSDGTVDTIQFQSDVVPEPATWLLVVAGLASLVARSLSQRAR